MSVFVFPTHTRTEENVHGAGCLRGCEAAELMGFGGSCQQ